MGTDTITEELVQAEHLRRLRTTSQAEVDERAARHHHPVRYEARQDRHTPAAH